jgi:hypothetical protein
MNRLSARLTIVVFTIGITILLSSLFPAASAIRFGTPLNLSNNPGNSGAGTAGFETGPLVEVNGNIVYVVWIDASTGSTDVYFKRSTDGGATFSGIVNLSNNPGSSENPKIAKSGNNLYIVWTDRTTGDGDIYFRRSMNNGASFDSVVKLSADPHFSAEPQIAASGSNVYVVWDDIVFVNNADETKLFFKASTNNGASFGSIKTLSPAGITIETIMPQIAASGNNVYVAGNDGSEDSEEIFFQRSTNGGASFSSPISINNNFENAILGKIVADASNVYLVWSDRSVGDNAEVFFRKSTNNGASFGTKVNLSSNIGESEDPQMGVVGNNVYVAWSDSTTGNSDIYFRASGNGGSSFASIKNLSNNNSGESILPQISKTAS